MPQLMPLKGMERWVSLRPGQGHAVMMPAQDFGMNFQAFGVYFFFASRGLPEFLLGGVSITSGKPNPSHFHFRGSKQFQAYGVRLLLLCRV